MSSQDHECTHFCPVRHHWLPAADLPFPCLFFCCTDRRRHLRQPYPTLPDTATAAIGTAVAAVINTAVTAVINTTIALVKKLLQQFELEELAFYHFLFYLFFSVRGIP